MLSHSIAMLIRSAASRRRAAVLVALLLGVAVPAAQAQSKPKASNDEFSVDEGTAYEGSLNVLANDRDRDGDPLTAVLNTGPSFADTFGLNSDGSFSYRHDGSETRSDSFTYFACAGESDDDDDDDAKCDRATVRITVKPINDPPTAVDDTATVQEDSSKNSIRVTDNDFDPDSGKLTVIDASASVGSATSSNDNVLYTPPSGFSGEARIDYTISDNDGGTDSAVLRVTVTAVNDAPVARDQTVSSDEDTPVAITLTATDDDGDRLTYSITELPSNGRLSGSPPNVTYTPDRGFSGNDRFRFRANDGTDDSNTATVSISIIETNEVPEASADSPPAIDEGASISGTFNVLDNDSDSDGDSLTAVLESGPSRAEDFRLNANGTFTYRHDGSETTRDSFTYRADDGSDRSNAATVTLTINPQNDRPRFDGVRRPGLTTPEDTTLTIQVDDLIINDPDSDTFTLTLEAPTPDAKYTLAGPASVTPAADFDGRINVRATVSDGQSSSPLFAIPVDVESVNDRPKVVQPIGPQNAVENSPFTLDVSAYFDDADGDSLSYAATAVPPIPAARGIAFDSRTGRFSGTPDFSGSDAEDPVYAVTVTARDPQGEFVTDVFELTISQLGRANLGLTITVSPETGAPNEQLLWTFTIDNPVGPVPGANVELSGSLVGNGLTVGVEDGVNCTVNSQMDRADFSCAVGALPVGDTVAVQLSTTASQATEVVAFATSAGMQAIPIDPNPKNNSAVRAVGVAESFSEGAVQVLGDATILSIVAGDVNGDGAPDIVAGTESGRPVQVYLGAAARESCSCRRDFEAAPLSVPDMGANTGVALADFDNNGTLDLAVANNGGQPDTVYANDGAGNYSLMQTLAPSNGRDLAVGDFNNDGNLDIAVAAAGPNPVYFGDGNGGFGTVVLLGDHVSGGVGVGRFNGDNSDDLVFANIGAESRVWTATAGGGFTEAILPAFGDAAAVAAADLNGDGLDDLVFGRVPVAFGDIPSNPVLLNPGGGTFGTPAAELGLSPTSDVLIGDVGEDGQLDIVFVNTSGLHQTWTGSGANFTLHAEQIIDIGAVAGVLADLGFTDSDDPGGPDLALGGAGGAGIGVYLNDGAGNLGYGDAVPPEIALNGEASVSIPANSTYTDAGATAHDNIDGAITPVATSNVDTAVVGTYTVTYRATDRAGNAAAPVERTVTVGVAAGSGGGGGGAIDVWVLATLLLAVAAGASEKWSRAARFLLSHASASRDRKFSGGRNFYLLECYSSVHSPLRVRGTRKAQQNARPLAAASPRSKQDTEKEHS